MLSSISTSHERTVTQNNLHIALLGSPEIFHAGKLVQFSSSRKALALLVYLVVEEKVQSRQKLAELLWPDSDAIHARAALRITLLELRKIMDVMEKPPLIIDRDNLSINIHAGITFDLQTVQTSLNMIQTYSNTQQNAAEELRIQLLTHLHTVVKNYRGNFLDRFSLRDSSTFDDWVRYQRNYWQQSIHTIFAHLSLLHERAGELKEAISIVSRWLTIDPCNEAACQQLMHLHFAQGNRIAALQTFDNYRSLLINEMQIEPSTETVVLKERIRNAHLSASFHTTRTALQSSTPSSALPFVGRTQEFNTLLDCFYHAQQGQLQVVTLDGTSGIGKTKLASEFLQWASTQNSSILQGRAFEGSVDLPFQPLIDALRPCVERENAPEDLLADVWLAELSRILPELRERYPDLTLIHNDDTVDRVQIFEAIARLCHTLSQRQTLVLFLDDLQLASPDLLGGLYYLVQRWQRYCSSILILLSFQSDQQASTSLSMVDWSIKLKRLMPDVIRIQLEPLTIESITYLLQILLHTRYHDQHFLDKNQHLPQTLSLEKIAAQLYTLTAGHTLYVVETIKALQEHQFLSPAHRSVLLDDKIVDNLKSIFPTNIREHLQTRLNLVTPDAQSFATAVALLKPETSFAQLCQATNLSEKNALLALDELFQKHWLCETMQPPGIPTYTFTYAKAREFILSIAGETRSHLFRQRAQQDDLIH